MDLEGSKKISAAELDREQEIIQEGVMPIEKKTGS